MIKSVQRTTVRVSQTEYELLQEAKTDALALLEKLRKGRLDRLEVEQFVVYRKLLHDYGMDLDELSKLYEK